MGVTLLLSCSNRFPGVSNHAGTTGHPIPDSGVGGCQEAPTGHGIHPNFTEHCHWIQEDLWPCHSMGTSTPGPLLNPSRCGAQAHAAHGWQCQLGVHLCPVE